MKTNFIYDTHQHFWDFKLRDYDWMEKGSILEKNYLPENLKPNIEFTVLNNIETDLINCFSNAGGSWGKQKITNITQKRIQISLSEDFVSGRGRINCTAQKNNNWYWFGYQFLVK